MLVGKDSPSLRLPWLTLLTGAAAALLFLAPESWTSILQLDRNAIAQDGFWQLFTGHLTHWNASHFIWDVVMFGLVGAMVEIRSRKAWIWVNLISAVLISFSVLVFRPDLQFYRGLSGLDMALAGYWVLAMFRDSLAKRVISERWMWGGALVLLFSKPLIEIAMGSALFVSDLGAGVENVALAHLVGVVAGVGLGVSTVVLRDKPAPTASRMKWIAG